MGVFMKFKEIRFFIIIKKTVINFLQTIIGTAIMAISIDLFLLPNQLSVGGFSGIGTIGYYLLNIPVGTTVLALNIPLFIFAFFKNGKKFFLDSVVGTVSLSFFLNLFENFNTVTRYGLFGMHIWRDSFRSRHCNSVKSKFIYRRF